MQTAASSSERNTATPRHELLDEITFSVLSAETLFAFLLAIFETKENQSPRNAIF
jgi:hypothetical protein